VASRSRKYTRPGADPEARFRPVTTPEQQARADEILEALRPPQPNYRLSEYDRQKIRENNKANLPLFWFAYFAIALGGTWLLILFLD
jgi:hypothetical protein